MNRTQALNILAVEDDDGVRGHLVDVLEIHGHTVRAEASGTAGLEAMRQQSFDLLITDLALPGMEGFELIEAIRAEPELRTLPIIVITASTEPGRMRRAMNCGADDYILKPFTADDLLRSIRVRMEKKALLDELDAFAHTVAHDLKNPIAVVQGRAELLQLRWAHMDDAKKQQQVEAILAGTQRLLNIIDALLLLAGVRKEPVRTLPLDMSAIVDESLARLRPMIEQSAAVIEMPSAWPAAVGHAPWVAEIWTNFLSNGLKYGVKYGGHPPHLSLGGGPAPQPGYSRFWVQDHGAGLSAAEQQRLFVPFTKVSAMHLEGSGLGLSIAGRIAERLHGSVGVDSEPGHGCCFWFDLPAAALADEEALPRR